MTINLSSYIESAANPNDRFRTIEGIYAVLDQNDEPKMNVTDISVDFEMMLGQDKYKLKCLLHPKDEVCDRLKETSAFIQLIESDYISDYIYLKEEMLIFDNYDKPIYIDVILKRIPKGKRLDRYIDDLIADGAPISTEKLLNEIGNMAKWLIENDFSHGKISSKTIWITPSLKPVLVDYSAASRINPACADVKALATLAAALYTVACEPRFNAHIANTNSNSRSDKSRKFSAFVPALTDLMEDGGPQELSAILEVIGNARVERESAEKLCDRIYDLAKLPVQTIEPLSAMLNKINKDKVVRRHTIPTLQERLVKYRFVGSINNMLMRAFDGTWWYYLDKHGKVAISGNFIDADDFYEGLAVVETITGYGLINIEGRFVIEPIYDDMDYRYSGNVVVATKDGASGLYTRDGESITGLIYDQILNAGDGLIAVKKDKRFGYINSEGVVVIDIKFDDVFGFRDGVAKVELNKRKFEIDTAGNEVTLPYPVK